MHGLEADYYNKINFVYLDIDDPANETFKQELRFIYQPQMFLLDGDGRVLKEWVGPLPREEFQKVFEAVLSQ
ncbi:MAG: TlpA family protein disulfide reductase [Anaerolineales bacterium]